MYGIDRNELPRFKEAIREKASLIYLVDHSRDKRGVYEM
jgi:hypothetical protein